MARSKATLCWVTAWSLSSSVHGQCTTAPLQVDKEHFAALCEALRFDEVQQDVAEVVFENYLTQFRIVVERWEAEREALQKQSEDPDISVDRAARIHGRMCDVGFQAADETNALVARLLTDVEALATPEQRVHAPDADQDLRRLVFYSRFGDDRTFQNDLQAQIDIHRLISEVTVADSELRRLLAEAAPLDLTPEEVEARENVAAALRRYESYLDGMLRDENWMDVVRQDYRANIVAIVGPDDRERKERIAVRQTRRWLADWQERMTLVKTIAQHAEIAFGNDAKERWLLAWDRANFPFICSPQPTEVMAAWMHQNLVLSEVQATMLDDVMCRTQVADDSLRRKAIQFTIDHRDKFISYWPSREKEPRLNDTLEELAAARTNVHVEALANLRRLLSADDAELFDAARYEVMRHFHEDRFGYEIANNSHGQALLRRMQIQTWAYHTSPRFAERPKETHDEAIYSD